MGIIISCLSISLVGYHGNKTVSIRSVLSPIFTSEHGSTNLNGDPSTRYIHDPRKINTGHDLDEIIYMYHYQNSQLGKMMYKEHDSLNTRFVY